MGGGGDQEPTPAAKAAKGETLHSEDYANAAAISLATAAAGQYDFVNLAFKVPPPTNANGTPIAGQEGLSGNAVANAGGGLKKGGASPSATGFMRDFTQRNAVSTPAKNKDFLFRFTQYYNTARHSSPM